MVRPLLRCHLLLLRRRHRRLPDLRDLRNRTVSLQAAIDGALPELRRAAEARMLSTCTVRHLTGSTTQNESTGEEVSEGDVVYTGPVRQGQSDRESVVEGERVSVRVDLGSR